MQINSELITEIILYGDNIVSKVFMITRLVTKLTRPIEKLTPEIGEAFNEANLPHGAKAP